MRIILYSTVAIKPAISAIPEVREHTHEEEEGGMAVGGMMEGGEKGKGMILQFSDNQRSETETDSEAQVYPGTYSSTKDHLIYSVGCVFMFIYSHTKGNTISLLNLLQYC